MASFPNYIQTKIAPIINLIESSIALKKHTMYSEARWYMGARDDFSWVYGLSETEIKDYGQLYENTRSEILNNINLTEHEGLKKKLKKEFAFFPDLASREFILNTDNVLWVFQKVFRPLKKYRKTRKFRMILEEIIIAGKNISNYYQNISWIEMENTGGNSQ